MVVLEGIGKKIGWRRRNKKPAKLDIIPPASRPGLMTVVEEGTGPNVDIVYIHGSSDRHNLSQTQDNFSTTELAGRNHNARILSWAYDTRAYSSGYKVEDVLETHTNSLLEELSAARSGAETKRRPIVFIAHSLGGILVKKALLKSNEAEIEEMGQNSVHIGIKQSTLGAVFLGSAFDEELLTSTNIGSRTRKLSDLQEEEFQGLCKDVIVEVVPSSPSTPPSPVNIFPPPRRLSSIIISGIKRSKTSSSSNSSSSSRESISFPPSVIETVSGLCSSVSLEKLHKAKQRDDERAQNLEFDTFKDDYNVGMIRNSNTAKTTVFVNRENKLSELFDRLSPQRKGQSYSRIVVLHGPAGCGKSRLALEFCQRHEKQFSTILWINASSVQSIGSCYATFANALIEHYATQLPDPCGSYEPVYRYLGLSDLVNDKTRKDGFDQIAGTPLIDAINVWLSQTNNRDWLMVFDNIDESDVTIMADFFPTPISGQILIITKLEGYAEEHAYQGITLGNMSRIEAKELLLDLIDGHHSEKDDSLALTIVDGCDNSPLSITQVANFINTIPLTLQTYLNVTETRDHRWSLDLWNSYSGTEIDEILNATQPWSIVQWKGYNEPRVEAYSSLEHEFQELDPRALDLLTLCSFFNKDTIPVALLEEAMLESRQERIFHDQSEDIPPEIKTEVVPESSSKDRLEELLKDLTGRGLITQQSNLQNVRPVTSHNLSAADETSRISGRISPELLFPVVDSPSADINKLYQTQGSSNEEVHCIFINPLAYLWAQKRLNPVSQGVMAERAFKVLALAIKSPEIAPSDLIGLAQFLPHLKSCLESIDMVHGDKRSDVEWSVLGDVCRYQGLHETAKKFYKFSLERVETPPNPDDDLSTSSRVEAAKLRMTLGFIYIQQKRLNKAEKEYKKAMHHIREAKPDNSNDDTKVANLELLIIASLASLYKSLNRFEEAEVRYYSILPRFEKVWGSEDIRTLLLLEQFASCLLSDGNHKEAEALYRRLLVSYIKVFGRDYPSVAKIQQKLAKTLQLEGRYARAEGFLQQALTATEKRLGKEHPGTIEVLMFLAQLKCYLRKFEEARVIYEGLLDSQPNTSGSRMGFEVRMNLGVTYQYQKKYEKSESMYRETLDSLGKQKGPKLQWEHELMLKLKALYVETKETKKAQQLLVEMQDKFPDDGTLQSGLQQNNKIMESRIVKR